MLISESRQSLSKCIAKPTFVSDCVCTPKMCLAAVVLIERGGRGEKYRGKLLYIEPDITVTSLTNNQVIDCHQNKNFSANLFPGDRSMAISTAHCSPLLLPRGAVEKSLLATQVACPPHRPGPAMTDQRKRNCLFGFSMKARLII